MMSTRGGGSHDVYCLQGEGVVMMSTVYKGRG